jgi:hypothetical protein
MRFWVEMVGPPKERWERRQISGSVPGGDCAVLCWHRARGVGGAQALVVQMPTRPGFERFLAELQSWGEARPELALQLSVRSAAVQHIKETTITVD